MISATLTDVEWTNTSVLGGYDTRVIQKLKDTVAGDIYVSGSVTLAHSLVADGLVDRFELFVYPVVLGTGLRLFPDATKQKLTLIGCDIYANGVVHLSYATRA